MFGFLVKSDRKGALLQPLDKLPASELKFVVDIVAGFDEMTWAQENVQAPLAAFGKVYDASATGASGSRAGGRSGRSPPTGCPKS